MIAEDMSIGYQYVDKLNMLAMPMTFGSLLWELRHSVLAKLLSCCEDDN